MAIFGSGASDGVSKLLERAKIETINSAYAEIPKPGEVVINPGDRRLHVDRVVALPELYGPSVRGIPLGRERLHSREPIRAGPGRGADLCRR